jgi:hypothetical protein
MFRKGDHTMAKAPPPKNRMAPPAKATGVIDLPDEAPRGGNGGARPAAGVKNKQAAAIRDTEVLQSVAGLSLDAVSGTIASTQVEMQKSLTALSAKLVEQLQVLRNVEEAIALKRDELKQLYDIESAALNLDDLEAQTQARREAWEEEQARKQREFAEMQSERNKQWVRSEEEYQYKLAQEHKKAEDTFAGRMAERDKANRDKQELLEKDWANREAELKKREKELDEFRAKVAEFPEVTKKEVNAAVAVATNSVKKEYETKIVLAAKDTETFQKLAAQETASLKETIAKASAQVADLKAQLEQAHRDVKEISAKALESASGRSAMEALQKVLEKEQVSKPGK